MDHEVVRLSDMVEYQSGSVVSRKVMGAGGGNVTVFAFDEGEGLSEHTSPYEARVLVLDGTAEVQIDGKPFNVRTGETIALPPQVPHALHAHEPFKMLLIMIRES